MTATGRPASPTMRPRESASLVGEVDGADTIGCELDGDPTAIAFHPDRLLDAITAAGTGRARIALTTPVKAALITPAADDGQDDTRPAYRHLLMPIRSAG